MESLLPYAQAVADVRARGSRLDLGLRRTLLMALLVAGAPAAAVAQCVTEQDCRTFGADFCKLYPCQNGTCVTAVPRSCDDGNLCTVDSCSVVCRNEPYCNQDGAICNGPETCSVVSLPLPFPFVGSIDFPVCSSGPALSCDDGNACSIDSCVEPVGCSYALLNCNDGNPCTTDECNAATGCANEPLAGCCRSNDDCGAGACMLGRTCVASTCTAGIPRDCDDGNRCTTDTCEPATGCLHQAVPACCRDDGDCPGEPCFSRICADSACAVGAPRLCDDGDPCTTDACDAATGCRATARTGFEALQCVCERAPPPACGGQNLPGKLTKRLTRACALIGRAGDTDGPKVRKLVGRAAQQFGKASALAARIAGGTRIDAACGGALAALLTDHQTRADSLREQL